MKSKSGLTLMDCVIILVLLVIVGAVLFPVMIGPSNTTYASHCQSNMNQIGKSIKMYLSDWDDSYPPNSLRGHSGIAGDVPLSDWSRKDSRGNTIRYRYGVNWVEALYPYVEKVTEGDVESEWRCGMASRRKAGSENARVSYAFNANMVEMSEGLIMSPGNLMMIREMDRLHDAALRPVSPTPSNGPSPRDAFLNGDEVGVSDPNYKLHADGSHILFADGHVKRFPVEYFPTRCRWDSGTKRWYNFAGPPRRDDKYMSIAVTP